MRREADGTILSQDFQALSLFRIAFSVYLLGDFFITVFPYFADFYGDAGVLPLPVLISDNQPGLTVILPLLSLFNVVQSRAVFVALYSVAVFTFAIGYRSRWATAAVFALNGYLYWRNPYIQSGAEILAHLLLLWCLFSPMARFWSIDAALDPQPRDRPYPALPFFALRLQIASLYFFAALFKIAGLSWRNGSALTWALSDNIFGGTTPALFLISHVPSLLYVVNYLVILFQIAFPLLVYCPWRNDLVRAFALSCSALMHISFIFFLNVSGFPYVCLTMLLLLVPDNWIERLLVNRRKRLAGLTIYYETGCDFCLRVSLILREFLLSPTSRVAPASSDSEAFRLLTQNNSWVVRGVDGKYYLKWSAMNYLLKQNPAFAPVGRFLELHFLRRLMSKFYDLVGANRRRLAPIMKLFFPLRSAQPIGRPALSLCGFLMLLAFMSNVFGVARLAFPSLYGFDQITAIFQVRQSWEVFAPGPTHFRHGYRLIAHMAGGSMVDLTKLVPTPMFRMEGNRVVFSTPRWNKYITRFDELTAEDWRAFGRYLCRKAQGVLDFTATVREVELTAIAEPAIEGTPPAKTPFEQRTFNCAFDSM